MEKVILDNRSMSVTSKHIGLFKSKHNFVIEKLNKSLLSSKRISNYKLYIHQIFGKII